MVSLTLLKVSDTVSFIGDNFSSIVDLTPVMGSGAEPESCFMYDNNFYITDTGKIFKMEF